MKTVYVCQSCGAQSPKWMGRCGECGTWNTLVEEASRSGGAARPVGSSNAPVPLKDVGTEAGPAVPTGIGEFDRVLGGGLVPGACVLIAGEPGIGKSTLLLQLAGAAAHTGRAVLYVTAEESLIQIRQRAGRLGVAADALLVLNETDVEAILLQMERIRPALVVVDSIQMVTLAGMEGAPGTVGQVRECAALLARGAKAAGVALVLIGHVTKSGAIAGPKVLEHIVDTVLYFEGDPDHAHRLVRVIKNRFGATREVAAFAMTDRGLAEVANPSSLFLREEASGGIGSAVAASLSGTRSLLVEVQALVTRAAYGTPNRRFTGVDYQRGTMILAVLEKRCGLFLSGQDVFVNAVGGIELPEPAADLAAAIAVASSFQDRPVPGGTVFVGEVGLAGEVRPVRGTADRLAEAKRLGFRRAVVPSDRHSKIRSNGLEVAFVKTLAQALDVIGGKDA
ncbi:MAG: DNA repair protein RadA [Planctomycetota bacterium]